MTKKWPSVQVTHSANVGLDQDWSISAWRGVSPSAPAWRWRGFRDTSPPGSTTITIIIIDIIINMVGVCLLRLPRRHITGVRRLRRLLRHPHRRGDDGDGIIVGCLTSPPRCRVSGFLRLGGQPRLPDAKAPHGPTSRVLEDQASSWRLIHAIA